MGSLDGFDKLKDVRMAQPAQDFNLSPYVLSFLSILNFRFFVCFNCDQLSILGVSNSHSRIAALSDNSSHFVTLQLVDLLNFRDISLRFHAIEPLGLLEVFVSKYLWKSLSNAGLIRSLNEFELLGSLTCCVKTPLFALNFEIFLLDCLGRQRITTILVLIKGGITILHPDIELTFRLVRGTRRVTFLLNFCCSFSTNDWKTNWLSELHLEARVEADLAEVGHVCPDLL